MSDTLSRPTTGPNGIPLDVPQWPVFAAEERAAAERVLLSGRVNYHTGQEGRRFESEFASWLGSKHAIALANGTLALELALQAYGIGAGAEVITTPRSFIASASAIVMQGAVPVFADVDRDSGNLTAATIRRALTERTRAIIVVHLAGWPADMDSIMEVADEHGLIVIEDCAQAHGATWRGRRVGSIGHAGAFSFCQDKIMTTGGEGGMLVLNDTDVYKRAWSYKDHGKDYDAVHSPAGNLGYQPMYHSFGTNWRLSEMQSAVGRVQLARLDGWISQREQNACTFMEALAHVPGLRWPRPDSRARHANYKLYAYVKTESLRPGYSRDRILQELVAAGVPAMAGSASELYLERAFPAGLPEMPVSRELGQTSLMFVVHPTLSTEDMVTLARRAAPVLEAALEGGPALTPAAELYERSHDRHDNDRRPDDRLRVVAGGSQVGQKDLHQVPGTK